MKNHIVFKFLAVLLCAASLLGAVASGAGILVMTEADLYQKTAEEAYQDAIRGYVDGYADAVALQYASRELGGANDALLDFYYGSGWLNSVFYQNRLGYVITDEAGNVLEDAGLGDEDVLEYTFQFQPIGQYLNVLSEMTEEEYHQANAPVLEPGTTLQNGETYVYDAVPREGAVEVYWLDISYSDGNSEGVGSPEESLGQIYYTGEGGIKFATAGDYSSLELFQGKFPVSICFRTQDDQIIYEATDHNGVLEESYYDGTMTYLQMRNSVEQNVDVYDAIPPEGCDVAMVTYSYDGGSQSLAGSPFGFLSYDENGNVLFTSGYQGSAALNIPVTSITFQHEEGYVLYEARDEAGVGYFYQEGDELRFTSQMYEEAVPAVTEVPDEGTESFISDLIPVMPSDGAQVYAVKVWDPDNQTVMNVESTHRAVGEVFLNDDGYIVFRCDGLFGKAFETSFIRLYAENGNVLFEAYSRDAEIGQGETVGKFTYDDGGSLIFTTDLNYGIAALSGEGLEVEIPGEENFLAEVQKNLYIQSSPDGDADVVGTYEKGQIVTVIRKEISEGVTWALTDLGWIPMAQLVQVEMPVMEFDVVPMEETMDPTEEIQGENFLAEAQADMDVLSAPNNGSNVIGELNMGDIVTVIMTETSGDMTWALTDLGWVPMDALVPVEVPVTEETVVPTVETGAEAVPANMTEATEAVLYAENGEYYAYYDYTTGQRMYAQYTQESMPAYTVEVQLAEGAFRYEHEWVLIRLVYELKNQLAYILGASLLLFAIFAVYLCCAAGKKPGTKEIHAGGLNAMPLELYACIAAGGVAGLAVVGVEGSQYLLRSDTLNGILCGGLCAYGASLLIVAFCFACAAQFKTPGGYWWRNSLTGRCIRLLGKGGKLLLKGFEWLDAKWDAKLWPGIKKLCKSLFAVAVVILKQIWKWILFLVHLLEAAVDKLGKALNRFFSMLPLTWQWLLAGGIMIFFLFITVAGRYDAGIILSVLFGIGLVIYGAHCFGSLLESAKKMSKGDLDEKVDDKLMVGAFKDFAGELNGLADVAVVAAQKQLKSERMKTELITNVSHDIKTPLTSIINYVDLLQKPHSDAEQEQYLEVLDRQSQRLKKLIDDLMEMSKASTGNLSVDITRVDAAEAVNQSLGEFADKLEKARLYPVFRQPEEAVYMMADGRLVWRVMSNLLSNAVKYALPGTRLYVDLQRVESKVIISMKNISREELNVNADELLERFVRGDASRNTEGSGLGLNIAQSLMELQKGQLQILVDGDLFKVTLIFPGE